MAEIDGVLADLDAGASYGDEPLLRLDLASAMREVADAREAAQLTRAVGLFQGRGEQSRMVDPCLRLAYLSRDSPTTALYWVERALTAAKRSDDASLVRQPLGVRGELLLRLGRADEALESLTQAAAMPGGSEYLDILACAQIATGRVRTGIDALEKSLAEMHRATDAESLARAQRLRLYLADAWSNLGERQRAIDMLRAACGQADRIDGAFSLITVLDRLGSALLESGDLVGAAQALEKGIDRIRQLQQDDRPEAASLYINLGNTLAALGIHDGALRAFHGALSIRSVSPRSKSRALFGMANVGVRAGSIELAYDAYEEARGWAAQLADRSLEAACLDSLGTLCLRRQQPAKAIDLHRRAARLHAEIPDARGQFTDLLNLVQAYLQLHEPANARRTMDQAMAVARTQNWQPSPEQRVCNAQILAAENRWPQANAEFQAGIAALEAQRATLLTPQDQREWALHRVEAFEIAAAAAIEANDARAAWHFLEGNRTRFLESVSERRRRLPPNLPEEIRSAYLAAADRLAALRRRRRARPDLADARLATDLAAAEQEWQRLEAQMARARGTVEPQSPVISPDLDAEGLDPGEVAIAIHASAQWIGVACVGRGCDGELWWGCGTEPQTTLDDVSRVIVGPGAWQDLDRLPDDAAKSLVSHTLDWVAAAVWPLIERVVQERGNALILMPGRGLNVLPLHAAATSDGRLALHRWAIRYAPSLRLYPRPASPVLPGARTLAQAVNPGGDLRFASAEAQAIRAGWRGRHRDPLVGDQATVTGVLALFADGDVLHFAGHGAFDPEDPLQSCLECAPDEVTNALTLRTLLNELPEIRARVMLLSACETGRVEAGDVLNDQLGLPGGLLIAGASAVLATFWRVDDLATCLVLGKCIEFWENRDTSLDRALAEAQAWLRGEVTVAVALDWIDARLAASDGMDEKLLAAYGSLSQRSRDDLLFPEPLDWAAFHVTGRAVRLASS